MALSRLRALWCSIFGHAPEVPLAVVEREMVLRCERCKAVEWVPLVTVPRPE